MYPFIFFQTSEYVEEKYLGLHKYVTISFVYVYSCGCGVMIANILTNA